MPWKVEKRDGQFCVIKTADGEVEGCHAVKAEAERQMSALYAQELDTATKGDGDGTGHGAGPKAGEEELVDEVIENQERVMEQLDEEKAQAAVQMADEFVDQWLEVKAEWTQRYVNDLPDGSFLFIEAGGEKDGDGKTVPRTLRHFPYKDANGKVDLPHLRNAIARIPQSNAKGLTPEKKRGLQAKARDILRENQKEVDEGGFIAWLKEKLGLSNGKAKPEPEPVQKDDGTGFTVWKEADEWRWLAVFSNNYRDDDNPPEIISKAAHQDFVDAVDAGEWPKPELWFWHVPGTKFGRTDMLAYDQDTGFTVAMGSIDKERANVAEHIALRGDWLVSHGMLAKEIQRDDPDDGTIITRYRSREISPLPPEAAANKHTWFMTTQKENVMAIPEKKVEELRAAGFDPDELSAKLEAERAKAEDEEREAKEVEPEVAEEPAPEPEPEAEPEAQAVEAPAVQPLTAEDVATAFQDAIKPLMERMEAVEKQFAELKQKDADREEKEIEEKLSLTPAASLGALLRSAVIGKEEARVDGRKARHEGPTETKTETGRGIGIPLIDAIKAGKSAKDVFGG